MVWVDNELSLNGLSYIELLNKPNACTVADSVAEVYTFRITLYIIRVLFYHLPFSFMTKKETNCEGLKQSSYIFWYLKKYNLPSKYIFYIRHTFYFKHYWNIYFINLFSENCNFSPEINFHEKFDFTEYGIKYITGCNLENRISNFVFFPQIFSNSTIFKMFNFRPKCILKLLNYKKILSEI